MFSTPNVRFNQFLPDLDICIMAVLNFIKKKLYFFTLGCQVFFKGPTLFVAAVYLLLSDSITVQWDIGPNCSSHKLQDPGRNMLVKDLLFLHSDWSLAGIQTSIQYWLGRRTVLGDVGIQGAFNWGRFLSLLSSSNDTKYCLNLHRHVCYANPTSLN